ncbi:MAG: hypothetical protein V1647_02890, partial [Pseudomonadota bacterium]
MLRFLRDSEDRFSLTSLFGVFGVFAGVFAIITVMSVMYGFEEQLIKKLIGTQPHVYITDETSPSSMNKWSEVVSKILSSPDLKKQITVVSPFVESEAIIYFNEVTVGAVVFGASKQLFAKMNITAPEHRQTVFGEQLGFTNR